MKEGLFINGHIYPPGSKVKILEHQGCIGQDGEVVARQKLGDPLTKVYVIMCLRCLCDGMMHAADRTPFTKSRPKTSR